MANMPGFEAMQAQQEAFLKAISGGMPGGWPAPQKEAPAQPETKSEDLDTIKQQLAELQSKLNKMS